METAGILVGLLLGALIGAWYVAANRRYSVRVLGYDPIGPQPVGINGPTDTARMLRAIRTPNADPDAEHERILVRRRFAVAVAFLPVFVLLPLVFDVIGAALAGMRGGVVGTALVLVVIGLLVHRSVGVARVEYDYGNGAMLRRRDLAFAIGGVITSVLILSIVAFVSSSAH
jgi:succinate dehydrogenase hydrophobic anchor subunit